MSIKISKNLLIFSLAVFLILPLAVVRGENKTPDQVLQEKRDLCQNLLQQKNDECNNLDKTVFGSTAITDCFKKAKEAYEYCWENAQKDYKAGRLGSSPAAPTQDGQTSPTQSGVPATGGGGELANPLGPGVTTFTQFVGKLFDALNEIIIVLAVFFMILAGFQFLTAQGNEDKIKKAKETLLWTVVGVAIAVGAKILITAIADILKTL